MADPLQVKINLPENHQHRIDDRVETLQSELNAVTLEIYKLWCEDRLQQHR